MLFEFSLNSYVHFHVANISKGIGYHITYNIFYKNLFCKNVEAEIY